jgi:2-oxoglutarate ferredoxin oxidoreductase subunit alpha
VQNSSVSVVLTGSGGAGVMTAGQMLLDAASRAGWYAYMTRSSGPQIRGGEAAAMLRLSVEPLASHDDHYHLLVAIDWDNVGRFAAEMPLAEDSLVLADPAAGDPPEQIRAMGARQAVLPMSAMAEAIPGGRPNMVALGAVAQLIGLPQDALAAALRKSLGKKGEAAISSSLAAVAAGAAAAESFPAVPRLPAVETATAERWNISGNEAAGLGAIRGGVRFVAAYPITPGTEVLEWLAPNLPKVGGVLVQAEDELASINQIIGASFGGVPSLTATSGPGLALMIESLGLAVASETPIVVVDVMRGGPSTGIPTKSEQSDLNIAVYGLHGDAPHVVVAPLSISDCLFTTQWAVHLAEALQTVAIVLSDQALGQSRAVIRKPAEIAFISKREKPAAIAEDQVYKRYAVTASGVSPASVPGMRGGQYTADGLEHNELGLPSSQASDHFTQLDKRAKKLTQFNYGDHWAEIDDGGDPGCDTAVITWGSCTGPVREAVDRLRAEGRNAKVIALRLLTPAQPDRLAAELVGVKRTLVVEQTHGAQFLLFLRAHYGLPGEVRSIHRPGPLPVRPGMVYEKLVNWG